VIVVNHEKKGSKQHHPNLKEKNCGLNKKYQHKISGESGMTEELVMN
jgi:hypothetical protein